MCSSRHFNPGPAPTTAAACGVRCSRCGQSTDSCCWPHQIPRSVTARAATTSLLTRVSLPFPQILGCISRSARNCSNWRAGGRTGQNGRIAWALCRRLPHHAPKTNGGHVHSSALIRRAQHLAILSAERLVRSRLFCRAGQSVPEEEATKFPSAHGEPPWCRRGGVRQVTAPMVCWPGFPGRRTQAGPRSAVALRWTSGTAIPWYCE